MNKENEILRSWQKNAHNWIATVEQNEIPSRPLATNRAIVEAVLATKPQRALDAGCGEGWLTRALADEGIEMVGIDGAEGLIERARQQGKATYFLMPYEELIAGRNKELGLFDTIAFNFSLFGKENTESLFSTLKGNLKHNGRIVIQTLHPDHELTKQRDQGGWVTESWSGMQRKYERPYQWYLRDKAGWAELFSATGYRLKQEQPVVHPETGDAISVIFTVAC